jgi:hypothetical protein
MEQQQIIESQIRVYLRLCPLNSYDQDTQDKEQQQQRIYWKCNDTNLMEETLTGQKGYKFDKCFHYDENNRLIYTRIGKQMVLKVMEGYHATLIACK